MKGIVITKMVIIAAVIIIAILYVLQQQGQLPSIDVTKQPVAKETTIKSTQEASKEITEIGSGVENVGSILEDIDKRLG